MATEENGGKAVTEMVAPVPITIIGTGDGLVTGTKATTPHDQPNIVVNVVQPLVALFFRFINVYIGNVVGLVTVGMTSNELPASDFGHLLLKCMGLAVAGAVVLSLKDIVTVTANLEQKYPLLTGSV
jgi:hypothetical protein